MKPHSQSDRAAFQRWAALLLVLVVALFGFVQAVHMHDGLSPDDGPSGAPTHCLICVAAHSVPVITAVSPAPVLAFTAVFVAAADPQPRSQLVIPSAFIRPPPQSL